MDFDPALAERIVGEMVAHAAAAKSFVRIDMEGSPYTEATIAMTERLSAKFPGAVGTVLQAYLFRTDSDTERLLEQGILIRLCKGAYKEGPEVAFPSKVDVDANYVKLMKRMVTFSNPQTGKGVSQIRDYIELIRSLPLAGGAASDILGGTAARLLHIEERLSAAQRS